MNAEERIKLYIKQLAHIHPQARLRDFYNWLLANGQFYEPANQLKLPVDKLRKDYKPRECFYNAQMIAQVDRKFAYVEGFYLVGELPLPSAHGWNVDFDSGYLIDVTAQVGDLEVTGWFGVGIPTEYITEQWNDRELAQEYLGMYWFDNVCRKVDPSFN